MGNKDDTNGETNNLQQVTRLRDSSIQLLYTNILGYKEYFATIGQVTSCGLRSPDEHLTGEHVGTRRTHLPNLILQVRHSI